MSEITNAEIKRYYAEIERLPAVTREWSAVKGATLVAVMMPVMLFLLALTGAPMVLAVWLFGAGLFLVGGCLMVALIESENRPRMR